MRATADDARVREVAGLREAAGAARAASPRRSALVVRLATFVGERFPPQAYGPLILALVVCGWTAAAVASGRRPEVGWPAVGVTLAVALAFLQLRILDEIRDADADRLGRPNRPVPRGLVTTPELRSLAVIAALVGIAITLPLGAIAVAVFGLTLAVIWVLGTDQPRRLPIRYGLIGEALVHSIIAPALLLFVWLAGAPVGSEAALGASLLLVWGTSLALEITRKTLRVDEERPGVSTYSAELGRHRALLLASLTISASCLGAGAFAIAVGAQPASTTIPLVTAVAVPLVAQRFGPVAGTLAVRSAATILVICLLLWPVVVMLELT